MSDVEDSELEKSRLSIVEVIEGFVDKITQIRNILLGISFSALVLAPLAIGLSIYLITHPHFFFVLDEYDEFGLYLSISLAVIIIVSFTWLGLGIRQYMMIKSWNSKYANYIRKKEQIDNEITSEFHLNEDEES
ncbi:MAG TPA: hypothetical protein VFM64_02285 [Candidatus Nitrosotenuis sp.]|nr:hypothetical protein [Candidatus Nitrosotenuis sp.]